MNKKAITQTMFNWIFIGIAGALILTFFVSVAFKQKGISEEKGDITTSENIKSLLADVEISKQTEEIIPMSGKEIGYNCQGFSIGSLSEFKSRIVFAPDLLKSNTQEMIFYSLEWRVPFRITNFLYITSPEVRYIIINKNSGTDDELINDLKKILPEKINLDEISEGSTILDENNYKIKVISFDKKITLPDFKNSDISGINIKGSKLDEYGEIDFYDDIKSKKEPYLKKESVIAAVFSENSEIYECNMEKAMEKLEHVYEVYKKRADKLGNDESIECRNNYDTTNFRVNEDFDLDNLEGIYDNIKEIENKNQIVELNSCALIY